MALAYKAKRQMRNTGNIVDLHCARQFNQEEKSKWDIYIL